MRFISTRAHGVLDYMMGILLIASPWIFGFADGGAMQWVPVAVGAMVMLMSLLTAYELGLSHLVPVPVHLGMDVVAGIFLAASPWLFGFADEVFWPHLIFGLAEIMAGLFTRTRPDEKGNTTGSGTAALK